MKNRLSQLAWQPPGRVDAALAALVALAGLVELAIVAEGDRVLGLPVIAALSGAMLLRRRRPLRALGIGAAALVGIGLLPREVADGAGVPFLALIFLVFSMAMRVDPPLLWVAAAATFAAAVASSLIDDHATEPGDIVVLAALLVAAPVAGGRLLRSRSELTRALRERADRDEHERLRRAEEAVNAERTRIAGELHDVVAHALGAMTVQAAAARRLAEKDATRASGAFQAVEETGREALVELRRLLGVLRQEDSDLALDPQPRLSHLSELIQRTCAAGLPVRLEVEGEELDDLPRGVDLTAYRVVQEALGEALRAGGAGSATVHVRHRHGEVEVEVVDDGRNTDRRLLGMRERVRVYGGQLEISPRREGGHSVRARLPVGTPA